MNQKVLIGLGVLAIAGLGIYMYRKNKAEGASENKTDENKSNLVDAGGGLVYSKRHVKPKPTTGK